jgi:hypothetical protein
MAESPLLVFDLEPVLEQLASNNPRICRFCAQSELLQIG